ncbi:hepcidin-like [Salvelinus fontinalis]|uniref:hepcidin-like n=1 Tax=Salvelinus fontinalis TaxID=8038 RepID=UPI002485176F|nr:hepcidin-like [Salvelinus fontinalis]
MKACSVAVAVVLVLTCMFILESTAVPFSEVLTEEVGIIDSPVWEHQQPGGESMRLPEHFRFKHQSHLSLCCWCCNCCHNKGCGFCCKF